MSTHLTDQRLIDYQFDLASEPDARTARTHLEKCDTCRRRLHELNRKLNTLDLLRDDVKASRTLLSETIQNAARAGRWRRLIFRRLPWMGAIAAAVIVGIALLAVPDRNLKDVALRSSAPPEPTLEMAPTKGMVAADKSAEAEGLVRSVPARAYPEMPYAVTTSAPADAPATARPDAIAEQPPFAPASAIELVVLPRREDVQLTIYNAADLTLVRERRNLTLKRGWNWLQFMWANTLIDPTSLNLEPLEHKGEVEVQQLVFPPRLRELGRWLIRSETSGQVPFELTYFTSGLSWRAFYMGTLSQDEKTMRLESYVRVNNNSGEDYEDAQTRLIVGQVHLLDGIAELAQRQYPYGSPAPTGRLGGMAGFGAFHKDKDLDAFNAYGVVAGQVIESLERKAIQKEGLSEYFLYTIEGTETIPNEWGKRLLSFEAEEIPVASLCKYDEERWGTQTIRFLSFANDQDHKLGETPLPDGTVRVYSRADEQGHLSYVGGMDVKYIPVGEEVELNLGPARLVRVEPMLMDTKTGNFAFNSNRDITGWDEIQTWEIKLGNARDIPIDLEITRGFDTESWELSLDASSSMTPGDLQYARHDVTHARFTTHLPSHGQGAIRYILTKYRGTRSEYFIEREKERSR